MSSPNRTAASALLGVLAAEYVLGWLPPGTHDYRRFVTPREMEDLHRRSGFVPYERTGLGYDPLRCEFHLTQNTALNYILASEPCESVA